MDLICLVDIEIKADGEWHQLALNAPVAFDHEGALVDVGGRLSEALSVGTGGGVFTGCGAEMKIHFRWVEPPPDED